MSDSWASISGDSRILNISWILTALKVAKSHKILATLNTDTAATTGRSADLQAGSRTAERKAALLKTTTVTPENNLAV